MRKKLTQVADLKRKFEDLELDEERNEAEFDRTEEHLGMQTKIIKTEIDNIRLENEKLTKQMVEMTSTEKEFSEKIEQEGQALLKLKQEIFNLEFESSITKKEIVMCREKYEIDKRGVQPKKSKPNYSLVSISNSSITKSMHNSEIPRKTEKEENKACCSIF